MLGTQMVEIPLPQGLKPTPFDLDLLKAMLVSIVALRSEVGEAAQAALQALERDGWHLRVGPTWLAEARRGDQLERATGRTPDEAVAKLFESAHYATGYGCP